MMPSDKLADILAQLESFIGEQEEAGHLTYGPILPLLDNAVTDISEAIRLMSKDEP